MTTEEKTKCPDCQVDIGEKHQWGCDVGLCKATGYQLLSCYTDPDDPDLEEDWEPYHECDVTTWTGEWPGVKVCRDNGWYTTIVGLKGESIVVEDLNNVQLRCNWNSELEDWEPRKMKVN